MNIKHDKQAILKKGENILRRQGYHNTGINQILKECNIPKGSFYNFFTSKEAFGQEVLQYYSNNNYELVKGFLQDTDKSPLQRLKNLYTGLTEFNKNEAYKCGCLANNLVLEIAGLNERFRKLLNVEYAKVLTLITRCISEAQQQQEVRDDYPAEALAEYIHSHFVGVLARLKATQTDQPFELFYKMTFEYLTKNE
ncbi:TetR/AcrR family transcriptional regulator [uncultured Microscilla sp.]|uniref:TetR/AcrR family transcriptional regulator n=1 Tax=uncultured Microscilla sp. TaxID=432653 RepID=UPI002624A3CF|nr:TetR/AcrR family transcriptional regulator [uncultured Microscilla sp.]